MANLKTLEKYRAATQFRSGEEQVKIAREAGKASGVARRKKGAAKKYLAMIMALIPEMTDKRRKDLIDIGADPDNQEYTTEALIMLALAQQAMKGNIKAIEKYLEIIGEDPKVLLEKERLKASQDALKAIKNSDGFMESMNGIAREVFADGGDTPDAVEDE